jgi:hypothetical protein
MHLLIIKVQISYVLGEYSTFKLIHKSIFLIMDGLSLIATTMWRVRSATSSHENVRHRAGLLPLIIFSMRFLLRTRM